MALCVRRGIIIMHRRILSAILLAQTTAQVLKAKTYFSTMIAIFSSF